MSWPIPLRHLHHAVLSLRGPLLGTHLRRSASRRWTSAPDRRVELEGPRDNRRRLVVNGKHPEPVALLRLRWFGCGAATTTTYRTALCRPGTDASRPIPSPPIGRAASVSIPSSSSTFPTKEVRIKPGWFTRAWCLDEVYTGMSHERLGVLGRATGFRSRRNIVPSICITPTSSDCLQLATSALALIHSPLSRWILGGRSTCSSVRLQ